jgi:hypothetical protein
LRERNSELVREAAAAGYGEYRTHISTRTGYSRPESRASGPPATAEADMHRTLRFLIPVMALSSFQAYAAGAPEGKRLFDRHCAECHAPGAGRPGTQQLGWSRGKDRAVLEQRRDLAADYISFVVRNGLLEIAQSSLTPKQFPLPSRECPGCGWGATPAYKPCTVVAVSVRLQTRDFRIR